MCVCVGGGGGGGVGGGVSGGGGGSLVGNDTEDREEVRNKVNIT